MDAGGQIPAVTSCTNPASTLAGDYRAELDPRHAAILKSTLEAHNYKVLLAEEGTEALALYAANREKIAPVMTDIAMPVLDGRRRCGRCGK